MSSEPTTFDVFLSHSSKDKPWVLTLKAALEKCGLTVWVDRDEIRPGDRFPDAIIAGLSKCRAIVFVVSPAASTSQWMKEEYNRALALALSEKPELRIVAILLKSAKPPEFDTVRQFVDFSDDADFEKHLGELYWGLTNRRLRAPRKRRSPTPDLMRHYGDLCARGEERLSSGEIDVAPYLASLSEDLRRGLTLIVRPSPQVAASFNSVAEELARACPSLFLYDNCRFHFTVLSLKTAVDTFNLDVVPVQEYEAVIRDVLNKVQQVSVQFTGLCATPNSVIAKGYPMDSGLEEVRTELRQRLKAAGLGEGIDERYPIKGAHVVLARFTERADFSQLQAFLHRVPDKPLGRMSVRSSQLVVNDFYLSIDKVRVLAEFPATPSDNLPSSPIHFIGRQIECARVLDVLARSTAPVILTSGFGGIGKSTLAVEVAHRCRSLGREYFEFIVWVDLRRYNASHTVTIDHILNTVATALDPTSTIPAISELEEKKHLLTQLLGRHRSLLLLDNYESVLEAVDQDDEIARFIKTLPMDAPGGGRVRVLITTRIISSGLLSLWGQIGMRDVRLDELRRQESVELMKDVSTNRGFRLTEEQYATVATLLHGLPKYMQVAMDQLSKIPFDEWEQIIGVVPTTLGQDRFFGDLFDLSWNRVLSHEARHLLMAMTYFVGSASFEALLTVTGMHRSRFATALIEASSAYLERVADDRYGVHPLTHHACRAFLRSGENSEFHQIAGKRFVEYFLNLAERSQGSTETEALLREVRNVVAAAQLAEELGEWKLLLRFRPATASFLRIRGFWGEDKHICELVRTASIELKDFESLAHCLVDDLAWLYLRLEDMNRAEAYAREGLSYFQDLGDRAGLAQAWRQLGKASLLRGEYDSGEDGGRTSQKHFEEADRAYGESLRLREVLQHDGSDQRERIADMKLDFGRLYWLRGRKYEFAARDKASAQPELLEEAATLYARAVTVSQEAFESFRDVNSIRGVAKALGNIGNAVKEQALLQARSGWLGPAESLMREAQRNYLESLKSAEIIQRKDEIAHACWGLAEASEFLAGQVTLSTEDRRQILCEAFSFAQKAHELYASLGGPFDQRTTRALVARIESALAAKVSGSEGA